MYYEFSVEIICSFLNPHELLKMRKLSRFHNNCAKKFIVRTYGKNDITDFVCPVCSYWIPQENKSIDNYTGFRGLYYDIDREERRRYRFINSKLQDKGYERMKLLCENCENEDIEINFIGNKEFYIEVNTSPLFKKYFKHRGDRDYVIIVKKNLIHSWAFLYLRIPEIEIGYLWNEFNVIVPLHELEFIYNYDQNY